MLRRLKNIFFNDFFLCFFSGLLSGLSFWHVYLSGLSFFSFSLFFYSISKQSYKKGVALSFIFGLTFYLTAIFWIGYVTKLGLVLLIIYLSLYPVLFFTLAGRYLISKYNILIVPAFWVLIQWLQEHVWCGFGWTDIGYLYTKYLYFFQVVDLAGIKILSFFTLMVNVFIFEIFFSKRISLKKLFLIFALGIFAFFYSSNKVNGLAKTSDTIKLAIVQPNVSQEDKWDEDKKMSVINKLAYMAKPIFDDVLVIYPETAWPIIINRQTSSGLKDFVRYVRRDMLIGVVREDRGNFFNSAFLINKDGPDIVQTYDKIRLVPFGEYIPMRNMLGFIDIVNQIGDTTSGDKETVFRYKGCQFTLLICFEDIFSSFVRHQAQKSNFMVNITNDAWFNGNPQAQQHVAILTARAVENGISFVRCANTGISGYIDRLGRLIDMDIDDGLFLSAQKTFDVSVASQRSFYNKYGDWFIIFCVIITLINELFLVRRRTYGVNNKSS
ncbi:MAG: apolipoprotein N-acyltransferase [Candidatus Omnitrophica bacterium]|nr:apolipoprotein N-acyltransferase [Candidatus Omnitrophota bacterium]